MQLTITHQVTRTNEGLYLVIDETGEAVSSPLPIETAVDLVRCFENGAHLGDISWRTLGKDMNEAVAVALGVTLIPGKEVVNGHEVETVPVEELKRQDMVVFTGQTKTWFVDVTTAPFRRTFYNGRTGETTESETLMVSIAGTRHHVAPGTTYRRALDPQAVRRSQWASRTRV